MFVKSDFMDIDLFSGLVILGEEFERVATAPYHIPVGQNEDRGRSGIHVQPHSQSNRLSDAINPRVL